MTDTPTSPRIAALREALAAGDRAALERFWAEVDERGTPLVDPAPTDRRAAPSSQASSRRAQISAADRYRQRPATRCGAWRRALTPAEARDIEHNP
jgi:hypothetical protein